MSMLRETFLEIKIDNLKSNISFLKKSFSQEIFISPMIKANAYGHGDYQVAKVLEDAKVSSMSVCLVEEGIGLRNKGIDSEILVFGDFSEEGATEIINHRLTPVVSNWNQIKSLEKILIHPLDVHVKFDTGMHRMGFDYEEAQELCEYFLKNKKLHPKAILSHLLKGEDADLEDGYSADQIHKTMNLKKIFSSFHAFAHLYNSAGIIHKIERKNKLPDMGLRPGLMIYGYNPIGSSPINLNPVMSLKSQVSIIRKIKSGQTVSYNGTWKATRDSHIAIMSLGYADGYPRQLSNLGHAFLMNQKVFVVGNICMDYLMLDITDLVQKYSIEKVQGQYATFLGEDDHGNIVSATDLAQKTNTIPWHILTSITYRVPRVYSEERGVA